MNRLQNQVYQDLTNQRFEAYIQQPLRRLLRQIDRNNTRLVVFSYTEEEIFHG